MLAWQESCILSAYRAPLQNHLQICSGELKRRQETIAEGYMMHDAYETSAKSIVVKTWLRAI